MADIDSVPTPTGATITAFNCCDVDWHSHVYPGATASGYNEWSIRIGEVLHQLRSALDHLAWQLVLVDGGQPSRQTQFPLLDRPPTAAAELLRQVGDPEILDSVDSCQPYHGRAGAVLTPFQAHGQPLWVLRCLNNIDKHRLLLVTLCVLDLDQMNWGGPPAPDPYLNTTGLSEGAVAARLDFRDHAPARIEPGPDAIQEHLPERWSAYGPESGRRPSAHVR